MGKTVGQSARELGGAAIEGVSTVTMMAAAGVGGWIGYDAAPDTWDGWQAVVAGLGGVAIARAVEELAEPVMRPLRRLTAHRHTSPATPHSTVEAGDPIPPMSVRDAIDQVAQAACADAASRAAFDASRIDRGSVLLTTPDRWQGHPDGTATCHLAPGAMLHYWRDPEDNSHYPRSTYTFVHSAADAPIEVTAMRQLRELLEAHANQETADDHDDVLQTA
ncbi:hypothetical protein [Streptomyces sp. BRA346]|uniref:hypothetical protein n=1 Tax=Streptomyces sp. BRA346 TaxID=2878199 RepID=UPI004062A042